MPKTNVFAKRNKSLSYQRQFAMDLLVQAAIKANNFTDPVTVAATQVVNQANTEINQIIAQQSKKAFANPHTIAFTTMTPGVGKVCQVAEFAAGNLSSTINTLYATKGQDSEKIVFDSYQFDYEFFSSDPFSIILFIMQTENGEGINTTEFVAGTQNKLSNIQAAVNGNRILHMGRQINSQARYDNGTVRHEARRKKFSVVNEANRFSNHVFIKGLDEENPNELHHGYWLNMATANTAVTAVVRTNYAYHYEPSS
jgi:hypothetical protein